MIDTTTSRLVERTMTGHRLRALAARPAAPPPAVPGCQALAIDSLRNLVTDPPAALRDCYDPCGNRASHQITSRCTHGHVLTWHVCTGCAGIIARQASHAHGHCLTCRRDHISAPVELTITPPPAPEPPGASPGCYRPGCPGRGQSWACLHCGDAYFSTPPDNDLCTACTPAASNL